MLTGRRTVTGDWLRSATSRAGQMQTADSRKVSSQVRVSINGQISRRGRQRHNPKTSQRSVQAAFRQGQKQIKSVAESQHRIR